MSRPTAAAASRPTLLNINNYHYRRGGAEVVFLEQSRLFREIGWEVVPFCMNHPNNDPSPWSRYWVDEIEMGSEYSLPEKVVRAGRVIYSRQAKRRLHALLDATNPQVAHLHNVYHHISPSVLPVLADRGVPTVLTTHDLKLACPSYKMLTHDGICERCNGGRLQNVVRHRCVKGSVALSSVVFVESALHRAVDSYRHVDRFVSPSRFYIDKLVEWGWERERFVHVPNHVAAEQFTPRFEPGAAVVYVGRLAPEKGLHTLISAAALADTSVVIVGTGPEEESLRTTAAETGARVSFTGYRSGDELADLIKGARAVALPSEWYENGPISLLEAYALGKPVIGANIGGIAELIREGETGVSFESGSIQDLARVMSELRAMPDAELEAMGRRARQLVEAEYTPAQHRQRLLDVYAEIGG